MTNDLNTLKAVARAAEEADKAYKERGFFNSDQRDAYRKFEKECGPQTVLGLIEEIETLRAKVCKENPNE